MSLIEQAAKRLEQLRQAGVELPEQPTKIKIPAPADRPDPTSIKESLASKQDSLPHKPQQVPEPTPLSLSPKTSARKKVDINLDSIASAGLLVPNATRSKMADEYRVIKRPLIANAMGKGVPRVPNGNLIMVTSALPGEGKSFTAINLAISIAMELDNTVMLVDADVARPSVLNMLGLPPAAGLLDVVDQDSVDISDVLLRTNIEKLSLLPSGTQHQRATELLASAAMVRLLHDMANRYPDRIIIFDSPPLLLTTEARALATHMGQVVLVVHAGQTAHSAVKEAVGTIESCPVKMMVLNQSRESGSAGYGYGYGYGYGQNA
ncbi:XrtA-associated tyrosine autokinase [Dechloromonas sp. ARDL1]|uniref:XrtA-associated tyrosine autokinase n=1 Tax=Dechloromonas sp. ARDL1 TaxID=3322121 RepID=UPI003DA6EF51